MSLELMAMRWLWMEKNCHYLLRERSPRHMLGQPDVIGITKDRFLIEIEIKRSMSDYRADFNKPHRANRDHYLDKMPKYFYYCAEPELAGKMLEKLPPWAGLLSYRIDTGYHNPIIICKAPANSRSKKLELKECIKVTRQMVNHLMSLEQQLVTMRNRFKYNSDDWLEKGDFQI